jgi:hypothetical protein
LKWKNFKKKKISHNNKTTMKNQELIRQYFEHCEGRNRNLVYCLINGLAESVKKGECRFSHKIAFINTANDVRYSGDGRELKWIKKSELDSTTKEVMLLLKKRDFDCEVIERKLWEDGKLSGIDVFLAIELNLPYRLKL